MISCRSHQRILEEALNMCPPFTAMLVRGTFRLIFALAIAWPGLHAQAATPTFVQVNFAVPQSTAVSSVTATFTGAQTAGNLNVVVVGWNDTTAAVTSLTDTAGNVYVRAVGPTVGSVLSQSIYYAKNIVAAAAGANRVT